MPRESESERQDTPKPTPERRGSLVSGAAAEGVLVFVQQFGRRAWSHRYRLGMSYLRKAPDDQSPIVILLAEDDPDDVLLIEDALKENRLVNELHHVGDGEELMEYLHRRGRYEDPTTSPRPGLILLDLNMPKKDGRQALKEIKSDPDLRRIPVVALTTSRAEEDIVRTYDLGVSSFVTKPVTFDGFVEAMRTLGRYWFSIVELPPH